jgi:hypothetical protein
MNIGHGMFTTSKIGVTILKLFIRNGIQKNFLKSTSRTSTSNLRETCLSGEPRSSGKNNKFRISGRMKRKEKLNVVYKHKLSLYLKSLRELSSLINMYEMRKTKDNLKLN